MKKWVVARDVCTALHSKLIFHIDIPTLIMLYAAEGYCNITARHALSKHKASDACGAFGMMGWCHCSSLLQLGESDVEERACSRKRECARMRQKDACARESNWIWFSNWINLIYSSEGVSSTLSIIGGRVEKDITHINWTSSIKDIITITMHHPAVLFTLFWLTVEWWMVAVWTFWIIMIGVRACLHYRFPLGFTK